PRYFIDRYSAPGDVVLDPFCGSGTTLVEARLCGRSAIGNDINAIGALISRAKSTPLTLEQIASIRTWMSKVKRIRRAFSGSQGLDRFLDAPSPAALEDLTDTADFGNIDKFHWFSVDILNAVLHVRRAILEADDLVVRDFLLTALSSIVVKVSNQESETRYAAVEKKFTAGNVPTLFLGKLADMLGRMEEYTAAVKLTSKGNETWGTVTQADARELGEIEPASVHLIVTSPPYANTYDYYLYHKLRMYVLGYDVEHVRINEIGSRNRYSSQKQDIGTFVDDMTACFARFREFLVPGGFAAVVIGDSVVAQQAYTGLHFMQEVAERAEFTVRQSFSYTLDAVSRLFNKGFRAANKAEWVILMEKT
ncbi:MAG TPA: DNA methyltransferase, partial [Candidatus Lokiarchaeia archaeon]|nr:DNA methyltransferase [Candidatus Lokiarchaeia archaeon]